MMAPNSYNIRMETYKVSSESTILYTHDFNLVGKGLFGEKRTKLHKVPAIPYMVDGIIE